MLKSMDGRHSTYPLVWFIDGIHMRQDNFSIVLAPFLSMKTGYHDIRVGQYPGIGKTKGIINNRLLRTRRRRLTGTQHVRKNLKAQVVKVASSSLKVHAVTILAITRARHITPKVNGRLLMVPALAIDLFRTIVARVCQVIQYKGRHRMPSGGPPRLCNIQGNVSDHER